MSASGARLPECFETERLILRCYCEQDAPWYYEMSLRNRDHLHRYESGNVIMSLASEEHAQTTLRELADLWAAGTCYFVGAFSKETKSFVAQVYVGPFRENPADFIVGYIADCRHQGNGYVTEAVGEIVRRVFGNLGAERVRIHCNRTNVRSRRVAERCGFQEEGRFAEDRIGPNGQPVSCTTIVYSRLHADADSL